MALVFACPECGARARLPDGSAGKAVRCPECGVALAVSADGSGVTRTRSATRPATRPAEPPDEDDDRPVSRPKQKRRPARPVRRSTPSKAVGWTVGSGVLVFLLIALRVVTIVARHSREQAPAGASGVAAPPGATGQVPPFTPAQYPPLPPARSLGSGVAVHELSFPHGGVTRQIWIYLPEKAPAGKLPCVLIAPAGTPLIYGNALGNGEYRAEHLPYVHAGFAVIAYSLDGDLDDRDKHNNAAVLAAVIAFKNAEAGVANARAALDYSLARVPALDSRRVYTAGHSSAATLSLVVAERDARIQGCIAYAPVTNVLQRTPAQLVNVFSSVVPGFREYLEEYSPHTHVDRLRCPTFLFHAEDDSNVPIQQTAEFAASLKMTNAHVTFLRAKHGDHYESMIHEGIPEAIRWLKRLPRT
jgi:dienelactone hydrolase